MAEGAVLEDLAGKTIGIIGCGHLGMTLAEEFLFQDFPKERLMISYGGSACTLERIKGAGLLENVSSNEEICAHSDIVFIAVRPQAFGDLGRLSFKDDAMVISCAAGISSSSLKEVLGINAFRIMPSGPDTIRQRKGIAAVYPQNDILASLLSHLGIKVYELRDEDLMHVFTAGVCLPAALLAADGMDISIDDAVETIAEEYPDFGEIFSWAKGVLPDFGSCAEREEYIRRTCTKGGVTEAIIHSINRGCTFLEALQRGIARSRELSASVQVLESQ